MTGYQSKKAAALDEDGMYLVHHTAQEPVAFINAEQRTFEWAKPTSWHTPTVVNLPKIPLYTAPPKRPWVDLTDESVTQVIDLMPNGINGWMSDWDLYEFARAVLAKSKEKNT